MRRLLAAFSLSKRATKSVDATAASSASATPTATKLVLPQWRDDVETWEPPPVRHVVPREQAEALVALLQSENCFGPVPCFEVVALYPECAWMNGFVQLTERQLHQGLSQVCAKVRRDVPREGRMVRAVCYVIPQPYFADKTNNVVAIGKQRPPTRASNQGISRTGSRIKAARPNGRGKARAYRADIAGAVACHS